MGLNKLADLIIPLNWEVAHIDGTQSVIIANSPFGHYRITNNNEFICINNWKCGFKEMTHSLEKAKELANTHYTNTILSCFINNGAM